MIFNYEYGGNACYIPLHLSAVLHSEDKNFIFNYISEKCVNELITFMAACEHAHIIIDLNHIMGIPSRVFSRFNANPVNTKNIILVNVSSKYCEEILHSWDKAQQHISNANIVGLTQALEYYDSEFGDDEHFNLQIRKCKIDKIAKYIKATSSKGSFFLPSSNVWSNTYVNIKKIFTDPEIFSLAIYELANIIDHNFKDKYDEFICVSNNGFAISNVLSSLLKKKVVYLMKLGPQSTLMSKDVVKNLDLNKRYLFIYDFSCLGTEIKLVKTIVNLFNSELVGCVGVAKYLDRDESSGKNFTIFKINEDMEYSYKLFFNESEVTQ
jgi:orotate phosphoribosyltransferase